MSSADNEFQSIEWGRLFPFLHLFRAFRVAFDVRKLLVAGIALMAWTVGNHFIDALPFAPESAGRTVEWPTSRPALVDNVLHLPQRILESPSDAIGEVVAASKAVVRPMSDIIDPIMAVFSVRESSYSELATAWSRILWWLVVWSFFGGVLTRMAAVQFAADERIGLREAFRFSAKRFGSFIAAPMLPIIGVVVLSAVCALAGFVAKLPVAGDWLIGLGFLIPLFLSFVMALVIIGVAAGWPLMFATIGAEGTDAFDGFSRSYSYIYSKPWHLLSWSGISLVYGVVVTIFVSFAASLIVSLTIWSVMMGMGFEGASQLFLAVPDTLDAVAPATAAEPTTGTLLVGFWLHLFALLVQGFTYSLFWTSTTILYFLVRRSDDATGLEEVYREDVQDEDELLPIVGVAASEQPVVERPVPDIAEQQAGTSDGEAEGQVRIAPSESDGEEAN